MSDFSPFLNSGKTFPSFQSCGTAPVERLKLKDLVKTGDMEEPASLSIADEIPYAPGGLEELSFLMAISTSPSFTWRIFRGIMPGWVSQEGLWGTVDRCGEKCLENEH